jgi:hypothetical protein
MSNEKLNDLRPYVTGVRFVKELTIVDVILKNGWGVFESETITYKAGKNNTNYYMFYGINGDISLNDILDHIESVININIEKENKLTLLKSKIEELKMLFTSKTLKDLEKLKFTIEDLNETNIDDLKTINDTEYSSTEELNEEEA